jgi:hypothetical protein
MQTEEASDDPTEFHGIPSTQRTFVDEDCPWSERMEGAAGQMVKVLNLGGFATNHPAVAVAMAAVVSVGGRHLSRVLLGRAMSR